MKKLMLLMLAIACFGMAKAQSDFNFGPKLGLNVTNISNSDGNNKSSLHFGGFVNTKLSDFVGVQAELLYSRQGFSDKSDGVKYKARVNYLNIPVLARLYVLENLSIDLGPQLGFALNAKSKAKAGGTTSKSKIDDLNTVDLSFAMGATYEFNMGLLVSARYNLGLTNVFEKDKVGSTNKNRVFQLSVGYKLDI